MSSLSRAKLNRIMKYKAAKGKDQSHRSTSKCYTVVKNMTSKYIKKTVLKGVTPPVKSYML